MKEVYTGKITCGPIGIDCQYCEHRNECIKDDISKEKEISKHVIKDQYKKILHEHNLTRYSENKRIAQEFCDIFYNKIKTQDIYTITGRYIWFVTYIPEYIEDFINIAVVIQNQIKYEFDFECVMCQEISIDNAKLYNGNKNKIPVILYVEP